MLPGPTRSLITPSLEVLLVYKRGLFGKPALHCFTLRPWRGKIECRKLESGDKNHKLHREAF